MGRSSRRWRLVEEANAAALYARCAALLQEAAAAERRLRALLQGLRTLREARLAAAGTRKASFAAAAEPPPTVDVQPLEQCADLLQSVVDGFKEVAAMPTSGSTATAASGGKAAAGGQGAAALTGAASEGGGSSIDASASSESRGAEVAAVAAAPTGVSAALSAVIFRAKTLHWLRMLRRARLALTALAGHAAAAVLAQCARAIEHNGCQAALAAALRLASLHNALVTLSAADGVRVAQACRNTCPALLRPLRRLSLTRLLQLAAQARSEAATRALVSVLLHGFHGVRCPDADGLCAASPDRTADDSSSVEVYRALTRHLTPPCATVLPPVEGTGAPGAAEANAALAARAVSRLDPTALPRLVRIEEEQVCALLGVAARACPELVGAAALTTSKRTGQAKATRAARQRVKVFYASALWTAVGALAEHELLWWGAAPLGPAPPDVAVQLRKWLHQLLVAEAVPSAVAPAVETLQDALCCHVTATSWDEHFRRTLVHARPAQRLRPLPVADTLQGGTETGRLFAEVLRSLVALSNACEGTSSWAAGAPLAELPLVEQIPVLHRLDHTVHTVRLWALAAARAQVAAWRVGGFALVSQWDVGACLAALADLRLADHSDVRQAGSEQVVVCARMRTKLVSEVRDNIVKLKKVPEECLDGMAAVCRTVSLANLHMVFPEPSYYRQTRELPSKASVYVEQYLERVLRPVLAAVATLPAPVQERIGCMVVRIMCEAWLDHIYMHRIKFTEWGALQLLEDFGAVAPWLSARAAAEAAPELRRALAACEALRRCEGVGRLLLRRRGERIPMAAPPAPAPAPPPPRAITRHAKQRRSRRSPPTDSPSPPADDPAMPAEMYVPNQEQWLELRTTRGKRLCSASLCCS